MHTIPQSDIDGVTKAFSLPEPFIEGTLTLVYNGQVYNKGDNIEAQNGQSNPPMIVLSFAPASDTMGLSIMYLPKNGSGHGIRGFTYPPGGLANEY